MLWPCLNQALQNKCEKVQGQAEDKRDTMPLLRLPSTRLSVVFRTAFIPESIKF